MDVSKSDTTAFQKSYAKALSDGDVQAIVSAWHTPSLVIGPAGTIAASKSAEVKEFFKASIADYRSKGISGAELHSADVTSVSDSVAATAVIWKHVSTDGGSGGREKAFYVLSKSGPSARLGIDLYSPGANRFIERTKFRVPAFAAHVELRQSTNDQLKF